MKFKQDVVKIVNQFTIRGLIILQDAVEELEERMELWMKEEEEVRR